MTTRLGRIGLDGITLHKRWRVLLAAAVAVVLAAVLGAGEVVTSEPRGEDSGFWRKPGHATPLPLAESEKAMSPIPADGIAVGTPLFSADSKRLAFIAASGGKWLVVVDGAEGKKYDAITMLDFGAGDKDFAYVARSDRQWFVVANGEERGPFDAVGQILFGCEPGQFVYSAADPDGWAVRDSHGTFSRYERVAGLSMSPDKAHVAWMALRKGKWFVVRDTDEHGAYDAIGVNSLVFSPDSNHLAYAAQRGSKWCVVVDRKDGREWDGIGRLVFSPDGKTLVYAAISEGKWWVVQRDVLGPAKSS